MIDASGAPAEALAEPRTLYVSRSLLNASALAAWAKEQGVPDVVSPTEMHVTIAYSKATVDWSKLTPDAEPLTVSAGDRILEKLGDGSVVALRFEDRRLQERWRTIKDAGATWDWPDYKPHVTLIEVGRDFDLVGITAFSEPLEFGPEVFAEVDLGWPPKASAEDEAGFREGDHPRADNGRFGSGTKAHIVTTHDSDTGETAFHHVGTDKKTAAVARDRVEDGDDDEGIDGDGSAEHHAVKIEGRKGENSGDAVHIVHAPDGAGGVDIHGAHLSEGAARGQAYELSKAEWEENGARRSEVGLSDLEKVDVAQAWNDEHAGDHHEVMVKVDDDGDPILDEAGDFQFTQDGEDVEPTDDIREAFGAVSGEMYPADEVAIYPGLEEANQHFTDEGRHEAVFQVHTHKAGAKDAVIASDAALVRKVQKRDRFALDRASVRTVDQDGHLHVSRTPISKANVCPYYGAEIPHAEDLGLDPKRIYQLYRHPDELRKGAATVDGKQLLLGHKPVSADSHAPEMWIGTVSSPEFSDPFLFAKLDIVARDGIGEIQSGRQEQLSCGYRYRVDMTPGTAPDGTKFDGVMRDIVFNHVAVVPEGRAGPDVLVLDSKLPRLRDLICMPNKAAITRTAASARGAFTGGLASGIIASLRPKLATDAKLDVLPMLKGITAENVKTKTPTLVKALDKAIRTGKLAKDADLDQAEVKDIVEQVAEVMTENAEAIASELSPEVEAETGADGDDAQLREMLKAKGYTEEEVDAILAKQVTAAADAEAAKVAAAEAESKKDAAEKAMDAKIAAAVTAATKGMVSKTDADNGAKQAADAAVKASRASIVEDAMRTGREIRAAEDEVRPVVGKLSQAHDSVEGVYRAALKVIAVDGADDLPAAALPAVFKAHTQARAAATPAIPTFAADAASGKSFEERFPGSKRFLG